jgi:predicted ester cyclase
MLRARGLRPGLWLRGRHGRQRTAAPKATELANQHDVEAIQSLLAADMRFTNPITGASNKEGMGNIDSTLFKAFPDIHYGVDRMIVSGDTYVMECTLTGTHQMI